MISLDFALLTQTNLPFSSFIDKKKVLKFGLDLGLTLAESATSLFQQE